MGARGMPQLDPTQQPQQPPAQPQAPDQIQQGLQTAAQYYQQQLQDSTPPPVQGGAVKRLLSNFFSGMGQGMMHESGLPTDYEKGQRAVTGLQGVANAQGMLALHQQMASQYAPVPLVGLDQKPILDGNGKQVVVPAHVAAPYYSALQAAQARTESAEIGTHKPISVPGVGAFNWDDTQNKYVPVQGAQIPQHQLAPGEAEKLGFPAGITQIPEALYAQAARASGTTSTQTHYLPDGAGGFIQVQTQSTRTPNISKGAGGPQSKATGGGRPGYIPGNATIYATDPTTGDTVPTTPGEMSKKGYINPRKVTQAQITSDQRISNRLVDVATKLNRYESSLNTPITDAERGNMAGILGGDKFKLGAFGAEIPVDRLNQSLDLENWNSLGTGARNRLISYYNMREAIQGYQAVLAAGGHGSDLGMNLNLTAVPAPTLPEGVGREGIRQFKENLPIAARGIPTAPGQQSVRDILNPKPSIRFSEGSDLYDIPADKVAAFKAKHPQAVPSGR